MALEGGGPFPCFGDLGDEREHPAPVFYRVSRRFCCIVRFVDLVDDPLNPPAGSTWAMSPASYYEIVGRHALIHASAYASRHVLTIGSATWATSVASSSLQI